MPHEHSPTDREKRSPSCQELEREVAQQLKSNYNSQDRLKEKDGDKNENEKDTDKKKMKETDKEKED